MMAKAEPYPMVCDGLRGMLSRPSVKRSDTSPPLTIPLIYYIIDNSIPPPIYIIVYYIPTPSAPLYTQWGVWLCVSMALWCVSADVERMHNALYKRPLYLYTLKKQKLIYSLVRVLIEEKKYENKSI